MTFENKPAYGKGASQLSEEQQELHQFLGLNQSHMREGFVGDDSLNAANQEVQLCTLGRTRDGFEGDAASRSRGGDLIIISGEHDDM
mmetsp:Transcript_10745/g.18040  ORF Transcript_10745/g.18040 Transcript_10745/m.18040 type:complete len:87 (-) Transcript_10745:510-770(-)